MRLGLGLKEWEFGYTRIDYSDYLRALNEEGKYPGLYNEITNAFAALRDDIEKMDLYLSKEVDSNPNANIEISIKTH